MSVLQIVVTGLLFQHIPSIIKYFNLLIHSISVNYNNIIQFGLDKITIISYQAWASMFLNPLIEQ